MSAIIFWREFDKSTLAQASLGKKSVANVVAVGRQLLFSERYVVGCLREDLQMIALDAVIENMAHYSGYVREFCLQVLKENNAFETLPYVLDRLNDWVPQVRDLAYTLCSAWLPLADATTLLNALPKVLALKEKLRHDHSAFVDQFLRRCELVNEGKLFEVGLSHSHHLVQRAAWACLRKQNKHTPFLLLKLALNTKDIRISWDATDLLDQLNSDELVSLWADIRSIFSVNMRRQLLSKLWDQQLIPEVDLVRYALFDQVTMIRGLGRCWWINQPDQLYALYLPKLNNGNTTREICYALDGLAKTRYYGIEAICEQHLIHPEHKVRQQAILLLIELDPKHQLKYISHGLHDKHLPLLAWTLNYCRKHKVFLTYDLLASAFKQPGLNETHYTTLLHYAISLPTYRQQLWHGIDLCGLIINAEGLELEKQSLLISIKTFLTDRMWLWAAQEKQGIAVEPTHNEKIRITSWLTQLMLPNVPHILKPTH